MENSAGKKAAADTEEKSQGLRKRRLLVRKIPFGRNIIRIDQGLCFVDKRSPGFAQLL